VAVAQLWIVRLRECMTILWIFMSVGALLVGLLVAWRVVRRWRGHTAWLRWFLAVMIFCLGIWIVTIFRLLDGSVRLGCLVSILALYLPILFASTWAIRMERQ
jgi:hypothetical protein